MLSFHLFKYALQRLYRQRKNQHIYTLCPPWEQFCPKQFKNILQYTLTCLPCTAGNNSIRNTVLKTMIFTFLTWNCPYNKITSLHTSVIYRANFAWSRVRTGHGKPGKSWNIKYSFNRYPVSNYRWQRKDIKTRWEIKQHEGHTFWWTEAWVVSVELL